MLDTQDVPHDHDHYVLASLLVGGSNGVMEETPVTSLNTSTYFHPPLHSACFPSLPFQDSRCSSIIAGWNVFSSIQSACHLNNCFELIHEQPSVLREVDTSRNLNSIQA